MPESDGHTDNEDVAVAPDAGSPTMPVHVDDAFLVSDVEGKSLALPGFRLQFDALGITVLKPDMSTAAVLPWEDISKLSISACASGPDGRSGLTLDVQGERNHRFVIPSEEPDVLQADLSRFSSQVAAKVPARSRSAVMVVLVVVLVVVAAAAIVLGILGKL